MAGRFSVDAVFNAIDRFSAPVQRMQSKLARFTSQAERGLRGVARATRRTATTLRNLSFQFGALAGLTAAAIRPGVEFEQAITNVGAVTLQTREQIQDLEQAAKDLGATTQFTATQAAEAMEILARAGFDNQQILQTVPSVLDAAAASGLEMAEVADHVSNVLKGMGLEMDQAGRVADVLALASSRTNSSIGSLGESMRNVASTARQLNVPLEDAIASVALLQDVGLDASVAGSAFNVMMTKMASPTAAMQREMRALGVSFKDAEGNMLSLPEVLEQLSRAADQAGGNFDKVAFFADLVGLRGQKAASNLADLFSEGRVAELTAELENATGAARRMAEIRMDTLQGDLTLLGSAVDGVRVAIFEMNSGPMREAIQQLTEWITVNREAIVAFGADLVKAIFTATRFIVEHGGKIAWFIGIIGGLIVIMNTLIGVLTLVNLVMMANPITLIVLAVLAAIAAFTALVIWIDDVASAFDNMHPALRLVLTPLELIVRSIKFIKDALSGGLGSAFIKLKAAFGLASDEELAEIEAAVTPDPQMITPQERTARAVDESRTTEFAEVLIRDETGRAEMQRSDAGGNTSIELQQSGAF